MRKPSEKGKAKIAQTINQKEFVGGSTEEYV
jgi:hypothetical protein